MTRDFSNEYLEWIVSLDATGTVDLTLISDNQELTLSFSTADFQAIINDFLEQTESDEWKQSLSLRLNQENVAGESGGTEE